MSTAVFYQQDPLSVEEACKYQTSPSAAAHLPLPTLVHRMPQTLSSSAQTHVPNNSSGHLLDFMYPVVSQANYFPGHQPLLEALLQNPGSYHLSITNTPATPLSGNYTAQSAMLAPHSQIAGAGPGASAMIPQHPLAGQSHPVPFAGPPGEERCTCKLNPNRIPRPRNAFILFRQKYHQLVLDELTEAKTNPEVSRELGRRWRSLSPHEREHWTNLAEEEKKNHAKKYPNYRYTPRRHGKGKHCPLCQQKQLRQAQVNQQQQQQQKQMMRGSVLEQDGLMSLRDLQKLPLNKLLTFAPQMQPLGFQQQYSPGQQSLLGQPLQQPLQQSQQPQQQGNPYVQLQMGQFVFQSPFSQVGPQFGIPDQQQLQQQPQQHQQQGSPQQGQGLHPNDKVRFADMPHYMGYEQQGTHQQRFNSLPNTMSGGSYNGPEVYMQPQVPHQR